MDENLTKELEKAFKEGFHVKLFIDIGAPKLEKITVVNENIPSKIAYLKEAYNDKMRLKSNPEIRIISADKFLSERIY